MQIIAYTTLMHSMKIHMRRELASVCMLMCIAVKDNEISVKMKKILTLVQINKKFIKALMNKRAYVAIGLLVRKGLPKD